MDDMNSAPMKRLKASLEGHLQKLREQNDSYKSDEIETAVRRGEIKAIKALLADMEEKKPLLERSVRPQPYK
ncbi:MAG: hypothetical protein KDA17_04655 [Candidatus Saccharibacteria bacterium]|nr:hypothetical protein [Candidatus Saccharibacteria bacterium]